MSSPFDANASAGPSNEEEPLWSSEPADEEHREEVSRDELYAVLNLPRECSEADIHKQYKRLAALLHPDRQPAELKEAADSRFQALNRAYGVLSDPKQRAVYDLLGEEGLKASWEVGQKHQTAEEMRAEFERLGRKQLEANVENLVKSRGELTCITDARVLFLPDDERRAMGGPLHMSIGDKLATVTTKQLFLKHSFTTPVTAATSVVLTSQLLARQGVGAGNLIVKMLHRPSSKWNLEIGTTLLRPRSVTFKTTYTPDSDTFVTFDCPVKNIDMPPPFSVVIGRRIFEDITATFTISSGIYALGSFGRSFLEPISSSTVSFGLINSQGWSVEASTGLIAGQVSADWGRTVLGGVKVRVGGAVTTQGMMSTYVTGDRKVTENTKAGLTLDLAANGVMTVKVRFMRLGQKLTFPVIIASTFNSTLAASVVILPAVSFVVLNQFVLSPRKRRRVSSRISELRKENAEYIAEKRREAEDAVELLSEHVKRKTEDERRTGGLVIEEALYGVLDSDRSVEAAESRVFDVTVAVQALVTNSQLGIPGKRSKANLLGFYDCAMGEKKRLRVRYLFKGRQHELEVDDLAAVAAPLRAHLVE